MCALFTASFGAGSRGYRVYDQVEINPRYDALSERERDVYKKMLPLLRAGALEIPLRTTCSSDEVFRAYFAVVRDHPELYHLVDDGHVEGQARCSGNIVTSFVPKPALSSWRHAKSQQDLDKFFKGFVRAIPKGWDDYRIVRYLYEWISMCVAYSLEAPRKRTVDGALLGRRAVCAGISDAFCYLARKLGIPAGCVSVQETFSGEWHRINIVRINGVYTYVDCTNGCLTYRNVPIEEMRSVPLITYRYLCFTTEELKSSFVIGPDQSVPICNSRNYDWFIINNLVLGSGFRSVQLDALLAHSLMAGNSSLEVKCPDQRTYRNAVQWLSNGDVYEGRFGALLRQSASRVRLHSSSNDKMRTITVSWQVETRRTRVA